MSGSPLGSMLDEVRDGLEAAAAQRREAEAARAETMAATVEWLRVGREHGVPIAHMAEWAGVTRRTVYDLLR